MTDTTVAQPILDQTNTDEVILRQFAEVSGRRKAKFVRLEVVSSFIKVKETVVNIWKSQNQSGVLNFESFLGNTISRHPELFPMLRLSLNKCIYVPVRSRDQVRKYFDKLKLGKPTLVRSLNEDLSDLVLYMFENKVNLLRTIHSVIGEMSRETGSNSFKISAICSHTTFLQNFDDLLLKLIYGWSSVKHFLLDHREVFRVSRIGCVNHVSLVPGVNIEKYVDLVELPEAKPILKKAVQRPPGADKTNVPAAPKPSAMVYCKENERQQGPLEGATGPDPITMSRERETPLEFEPLLKVETECLLFLHDHIFLYPKRRMPFSKISNGVKCNGNFKVRSYLTEDTLKKFVLRHYRVFPIIFREGQEFHHVMVEESDFALYIDRDLPSKVRSLADDLKYWRDLPTALLKAAEIDQEKDAYNVDLKCLLFLKNHVFVVPDRPVSFVNMRVLMDEYASHDVNERLALRRFDHFMMVEHEMVFPRSFTDDGDLVCTMVSEEDFDKYLRRLT